LPNGRPSCSTRLASARRSTIGAGTITERSCRSRSPIRCRRARGATVPQAGLNPSEHLALGRALGSAARRRHLRPRERDDVPQLACVRRIRVRCRTPRRSTAGCADVMSHPAAGRNRPCRVDERSRRARRASARRNLLPLMVASGAAGRRCGDARVQRNILAAPVCPRSLRRGGEVVRAFRPAGKAGLKGLVTTYVVGERTMASL